MNKHLLALALGLPFAAVAAGEELPPRAHAPAEFLRQVADPQQMRCHAGETVALDVAIEEEPALASAFDPARGELHILYRMNFNDITEGWNWHPEAAQQGGDYYAFKYLPLGSVEEHRGSYRSEDIAGNTQVLPIEWRYNYYFAFDNPGDFYAPRDDRDYGFAADVTVSAADAERLAQGDLHMALIGRLAPPCTTESTTFWKAIPARPVDFTLKKRYLIGTLSEVIFYDHASGKALGRVVPHH